MSWIRVSATAALTLAAGVAAFGIAPDTTLERVPTETVVRELELALPAPDGAEPESYWREERVQRGDTVGAVLARLGVEDPQVLAFLRTNDRVRPLQQLRPGRALRAQLDDDGGLRTLRYLTASGDMLSVERDGDAFRVALAVAPTEVRLQMRTGRIQSSLFAAADAVGLPDAVTMQLAEMFSGDIDFYHDLRRGDRFSVVYETHFVDGEFLRAGRVVAAEFSNRGNAYRAYRWLAPDGSEGFYTADGKSLRKAFLRSPMEFSRITSGFSFARVHPIFNVSRAHKGVDYAAPTGTPVRTTGDGKVAFAGVQGGYGNVVVVQHHGAFTTLYAHLSRIAPGLRVGSRVGQGEVIGFVGQTGWATGPHLHYEFRVNNVEQDPQRIALPEALPVAAELRPAFLAAIAPLVGHVELLQGLPVALVD